MNCTNCQTELSAFVDGELAPMSQRAVELHLATCDVCAAEREQLEQLAGELAEVFADMRRAAPACPARFQLAGDRGLDHVSMGAGIEGTDRPNNETTTRPRPVGRLFGAAALVMVFGGLAWLAASSPFAKQPDLSGSEAERLRLAGAAALADLAMSTEFVVDVPTKASTRRFHFARGADGAYLWQPAEAEVAGFDPTRYLAGSDGRELWVSAPRAQRLPIDASHPPLPRELSLALAQLALTDTSATSLGLYGADPETVWFRADTTTTSGPLTTWVWLDRQTGALLRFQLDMQPGESLELAILDGGGAFDFTLDPNHTLAPDLTASQAPLDTTPLPEALWQLGYTPGTTLPPEALESFSASPAFGYL